MPLPPPDENVHFIVPTRHSLLVNGRHRGSRRGPNPAQGWTNQPQEYNYGKAGTKKSFLDQGSRNMTDTGDIWPTQMPRKSNLIRKHLQHNISRGRVSRNLVDIPPSYLVTIDNAQTLHRSRLVSDFGRCSFSAACCMLQFGLKCEGSVYWCSLRQGICMILPVSHVSTLNPCLHCLPCLPCRPCRPCLLSPCLP